MKKRRWLVPLSVFILLLLVIPIPTGIYKDGGTRAYTALTYRIVDWNHLYAGGMYDETKIYPFPMNFMSINSLLEREEKNMEEVLGNSIDKQKIKQSEFEAQYIRTDGYSEGAEHPAVKIIRSVEELNAYYEVNKELCGLARRDDPAPDRTNSFLEACKKYDEAYFKDRILVMVLLEEGSGSNRHQVKGVSYSEKTMFVEIDTIIPESGTADMAQWHILIEPEAGVDVASESDVTLFLDGVNVTDKSTLAQHSKGFANISINIADGWEYEVEESGDNGDFCIAFWPEEQSAGKIKVWYYSAFGVCGTGLEQEEITLGNYDAYKGTYDDRAVWDFISLRGTPGSYVVLNEGADAWWNDYGDKAMQILNTLVVGDGILSEKDAIDIAKSKTSVEYSRIWATFDAETGIWTVHFTAEDVLGGDQTVTMDADGNVIDVISGE